MPDSESRPEQRRQDPLRDFPAGTSHHWRAQGPSCEIQDFCLGGLYLRLNASDDARYAARP